MTESASTPHWRIITAFLLDLILSFVIIGYVVAAVTGQTTKNGFQLNGLPALVWFGLIIAYFIVGGRTGGTVFQRLLRTR